MFSRRFGRTKNKLFYFIFSLFLCWGCLPIWGMWFYQEIWRYVKVMEDRVLLGFLFTNSILTGFASTWYVIEFSQKNTLDTYKRQGEKKSKWKDRHKKIKSKLKALLAFGGFSKMNKAKNDPKGPRNNILDSIKKKNDTGPPAVGTPSGSDTEPLGTEMFKKRYNSKETVDIGDEQNKNTRYPSSKE